jgi:molecular chaperone IbpA
LDSPQVVDHRVRPPFRRSRRGPADCRRELSPYNIERLDENRFQISVALAGFTPDEIALTVEQIVLTLEGRKSEKRKSFPASRHLGPHFKRQFMLADHVEVKGARFENGLLVIDPQRKFPKP